MRGSQADKPQNSETKTINKKKRTQSHRRAKTIKRTSNSKKKYLYKARRKQGVSNKRNLIKEARRRTLTKVHLVSGKI